MVSTHLEKIFYHYVMENKELANIVEPRFFETEDIRKAYELSTEFMQKYGSPPTASQLIELAKMQGLSEELSGSKLDLIYETDLTEYEKDWLKESAEAWIEFKNLDISVVDLIAYLKTTKISNDNIKEVVQTAKSIIADRNNIHFGFDEGLDFFDPSSHLQLNYIPSWYVISML